MTNESFLAHIKIPRHGQFGLYPINPLLLPEQWHTPSDSYV